MSWPIRALGCASLKTGVDTLDASSANAASPMAGVDGGYHHQHGASVSALVALSSSHGGAGVGATGVSGGGATNTKYALQRAFLRNQPALRRIVDFAVRPPHNWL